MADKSEEAFRAVLRAESRSSAVSLRGTNINSYIAKMTDLANLPPFDTSQRESELHDKLRRTAEVFSYIRDNQQAQTVGDAMDALSEGKIDPKVVKLWVEEDMIPDAPGDILLCALRGYPDLRDEILQAHDRATKRVSDLAR